VNFNATSNCLGAFAGAQSHSFSYSGPIISQATFAIIKRAGTDIIYRISFASNGTTTWQWLQNSNTGGSVLPDTYMAVIAATVGGVRMFYTADFKIHPTGLPPANCGLAPDLVNATFLTNGDQFGFANGAFNQSLPNASTGGVPITIFDASLNKIRDLKKKPSTDLVMVPNEVRCWGWDKKKTGGSPALAGRYLAVLETSAPGGSKDPALYDAAFTFNPKGIPLAQLKMCYST
jgi:hypothetical protein